MGTVTAYNLASVQAALGGANPISMNEYYRGGAYVPSTRTTVNDSGWQYNPAGNAWTFWYNISGSTTNQYCYFGNVQVWGPVAIGAATSYTSGGYTYYKGTFRGNVNVGGYLTAVTYEVKRTWTTTVSINTGVPSSGAISISQLYGAANP